MKSVERQATDGIDEKGLHLHEKELESFIISKNVVLYNIFFSVNLVLVAVCGVSFSSSEGALGIFF